MISNNACTRYAFADEFWKKLERVPRGLRRAAAGLATLPSPAVYDRLARPLIPLLPEHRRHGRVGDKVHKLAKLLSMQTSDDVYRHLCSHWTNPADIVIGGREQPTMLIGLDTLPSLPGNVERMMYVDLMSYLPDDILVKVDRAAMAVSLETRVPMLDHRIVEFAMSLPLAILRAENKTKWPLRQLLYKHVPKVLVERPKMGFGVPIDNWLRGALRDWAEDLLSEASLKADVFLVLPRFGSLGVSICREGAIISIFLGCSDVPSMAGGAKGISACFGGMICSAF